MRVHTSATRGLIPLLGAFALVSCTGSVPAPIAVIAGSAQTVNTGDFVQLDGSGSSDPQNRAITFSWSFAKRPLGSQISLIDASSPTASFKADAPGEFVVELTVSNSLLVSAPARVTVTVADCGAHAPGVGSISISSGGANVMGTAITLQANNVSDTNCLSTGSPQLQWSLTVPAGSRAALGNVFGNTPTFLPDVTGAYLVSVTARNSEGKTSDAVFLTINVAACSPAPLQRPTILGIATTQADPEVGPLLGTSANPIPHVGTTVTLIPDGVVAAYCGAIPTTPLTYSWIVTQRPAGSLAQLDSSVASSPTFTPDKVGHYQFAVGAKDAFGNSTSKTFDFDTSGCGTNPIAATIADVPGLRPFDDHLLTALPAVVPDPLVPGHKVFTLDDEPAICPSRFGGRSIFTWGVSSSAPSAGFVFDTLHGTQVKFTPGGNGIYDVKLAVDGPIAHADALIEVFVSCSDVVPKTGAITLTSGTAGYPAGMFFRDDTAMLSAAPSSLCLSSGSTAYSYLWSLVSRPAGSASVLSLVTSSTPTFTADVPSGTWTASVIVVDKLGNRSLPTTASFTSESCGINPVNVSFTDTRIGVSPFAAFDPHSLTAAASSDDDVSTKCPARFKNNSYVFTNLGITAPAGATKWMFTPTASNSGRFEAGENGTYRAGVSARGSTSNVSGLGTFDVSVSCVAGNEIPHASAPAITHVDDPDGVMVSGKIFRGETVTVGTTPTAACYTGANFHPQYAWGLVSADDGSAVLTPTNPVASPSFFVGVSGAAYDVRASVTDQWGNGPGSSQTLLVAETCGANPVLVSFAAPTQESGTLPFDPWSALATATSDDDNVAKCPQQRFHQSYGIGWAVTSMPSGATKYSLSTTSGSQTIFREGEPASGNYTLTATGTASASGKTGSAAKQISTAACTTPGPTFTRETGTVSAIGISATPPTPDPAPDYYAAHPEDFFTGDTVHLTAPTTFSCYTSQADAAATYSWSTVTPPSISFAPNATSATPTFVADAANKAWHLKATVQDHWGNSDSRTRDISSGVCGAAPITAMIGTTQATGALPMDPWTLTASPATGSHFSADSDRSKCPARFAPTYTFAWSSDALASAFSSTSTNPTTFTPAEPKSYAIHVVVSGNGQSGTADATVNATCSAPVVSTPTVVKVNGAAPGAIIYAGDAVKVGTSVASACFANPTLGYTYTLQRDGLPAPESFSPSATDAQPSFVPQAFGASYAVAVAVSDGSGQSTTSSALQITVSQCGSAAPVVSLVNATQHFATIHRATGAPPFPALDPTLTPPATEPTVIEGSVEFPVPFYLATPVAVRVQVDSAAGGSCPSFGFVSARFVNPDGNDVATTDFTSPSAGSVTDHGNLDFSFTPHIGDHTAGTPPLPILGNYQLKVTLSYGRPQTPSQNELSGPVVHVGGHCGLNAPFPDLTFTPVPPSPVGTIVSADASPSNDADNVPLQLVTASPIFSSGCGLDQPLTYAWALASAPVGSSAVLSATTGVLTQFTPDFAGTYDVQLTVTDATSSGINGDGTSTASFPYDATP